MIDPHPEDLFFFYMVKLNQDINPLDLYNFIQPILQCFWIDTIFAEMAVLFRTVHDHDNQIKLKSTDIKMNRQDE